MQTPEVASDIAGFDYFPVSLFRVPAPIGLRNAVSVNNDIAFSFGTGLLGERAHPRDRRCAIKNADAWCGIGVFTGGSVQPHF